MAQAGGSSSPGDATAAPAAPPSFMSMQIGRASRRVEIRGAVDASETREVKMIQSVAIDNCQTSHVTLSGKCAKVDMHASQGCIVTIGSVISGVDINNCNNIDLTVQGTVQAMQLDHSVGVVVRLSARACADVRILSSKCEPIRLVIAKASAGDQADDADDFLNIDKIPGEYVIPATNERDGDDMEQSLTYWDPIKTMFTSSEVDRKGKSGVPNMNPEL